MLSNMDDIRNIDESISDIYKSSIDESNEKNVRHRLRTNLEDIIALNRSDNFLKISTEPEEKYALKKINETIDNNTNLLSLPVEQKPLHKLYGSTKYLFTRQKSIDITEETPFLLAPTLHVIDTDKEKELKIPKHDSQESVQRVITERRKLDDNFKDIDQYDIFDVSSNRSSSSEENLIDNNKDNLQNINNDTNNITIEVNIIKERENDMC